MCVALALSACGSLTPPVEPDLCASHVNLNDCPRDGADDAADASADH
jgi:hypothetical protein